jgi:hypothetical protein
VATLGTIYAGLTATKQAMVDDFLFQNPDAEFSDEVVSYAIDTGPPKTVFLRLDKALIQTTSYLYEIP